MHRWEWFGPCGGPGVVVPIVDTPLIGPSHLPSRGKVWVLCDAGTAIL